MTTQLEEFMSKWQKPSAKVILHSKSPDGINLMTMEVSMHRFALAEFNTHRAFSRNAASSRAIPIKKMLDRIKESPAMPVFWGKNQSGMQAAEELTDFQLEMAVAIWERAKNSAVSFAELLSKCDLHKQLTNRIVESWMWCTDIVSFTEIDNFFWQRCDAMALPEFKAAADAMQLAYYQSIPQELDYGVWHTPYIQEEDWFDIVYLINPGLRESNITDIKLLLDELTQDELQRYIQLEKSISTARCGRVSYLNHDGVRRIEDDIDMHDNKLKAHLHPSPFEHVATPCPQMKRINELNSNPCENEADSDLQVICKKWGNFYGWDQYRKELANENRKNFVPNLPQLIGGGEISETA